MNQQPINVYELLRYTAYKQYKNGIVEIVGHAANPSKIVVRSRQITIFEVINQVIRPEGSPAFAGAPPA